MEPLPAWLNRIFHYDLSPMRPDEFIRTDALRWTDAMQLFQAWNAGVADAAAEKEAADSTTASLSGLDTEDAVA